VHCSYTSTHYMNYSVINAQRQTLGPMPEFQVRELLSQGVISLDSLAWKPGMANWEPLRSFSEFIDVPNQSGQSARPHNPYAPPQSAEYFPKGEGSLDKNASSKVRGEALTREVLERGYQINILHCLSRGWDLVFSRDFWSILGVHTLACFTQMAAGLLYVQIVVGGPMLGGVDLYFLKRIRGEEATLSTAFSGFNIAFVQLFVVVLVAGLLSMLGFLLLIIPGIYLSIAYGFARTLVIDKNLEFWDAMECSRKVISAHWFKFFGLMFVIGFCHLLGVLALILGIFIAMPICHAALMFAYEDIFNPKSDKLGNY
jgi:uncharacterized membrane protein